MNAKVLTLRAEKDGSDSAEKALLALFAGLAAGRLDDARAHTTTSFTWFGKPMGDAEWSGAKLRSFVAQSPPRASVPRSVPRALVDQMPAYAVERVFGDLDPTDRVVLADVTRADATTTILAVVAAGSGRTPPRVRRVLDPEAFVSFVDYAAIVHHIAAS